MTDPTPREATATRGRLLAVVVLASALVAASVLAAAYLPAAVSGPGGRSPGSAERPSVADQLRGLHADGVTGAGVTVAVLDPTGFDVDHPALSGRVVRTRSFGAGGIRNGGDDRHGTAAAAVVARTAPAAELYLATFDTDDGFVDAVDWLVRRGVDVIVAPAGFYGKRGDGSSRVARAAAGAVRRGVVFVAPVGNLGRGHWQGAFAPDDRGVHRFSGGTRNYLLGDGRTASLWLSWPDGPPDGSFALELYRTNGSASRLVARSQPFIGDDVPNERIVADVDPRGTYYVVVRGPTAANGSSVEVSSPSHAFQYRRRGRSVVAPATADDVVAVGALYDGRDRVAPYSSAGPVADGRPGVDVVAPGSHAVVGRPSAFVGSSAAAAHVGGVVALVLDANPDLRPAAVEVVLRTTARDVARPGVDAVAGAGVVDPRRAVARGRNATQSSI